MGVQDVIALAIAGGAVYFVIRTIRRSMCGTPRCGCSGESRCSAGAEGESRRMPKRVPYVPADQLMSVKRDSGNEGA